MKIKTQDLEDAQLDAAVAMAEGIPFRVSYVLWEGRYGRFSCFIPKWHDQNSKLRRFEDYSEHYNPSFDWKWGGPIIESNRISLIERAAAGWAGDAVAGTVFTGDTPLVAAMRAYVGSKMGDEVDVPDCVRPESRPVEFTSTD